MKGLARPSVVLAPQGVGAPVIVPRPPVPSEAVTCAAAPLPRALEVDGCGGNGARGAAAPAAFAALRGAVCGGPGDAGLPPQAEFQEDVAACGGYGKGAGMARPLQHAERQLLCRWE